METYEINQFLEVSEENNIEMKVFTPEQFELIITRDDRKSILLDEKQFHFLISSYPEGEQK